MNKKPYQPQGVPYGEPMTRVAMGPVGPAAGKKGAQTNAAGIVGAAVGGAALGAGGILLTGAAAGPDTEETETETTTEESTVGSHPLVDSHVSVATGVNDSMTFSQAFAAARAEVGAGGAFEWHGQVYGTYYKTEWDAMSAADKAEWNSHFAWSKNFHGDHGATTGSLTVTHTDGSTSHLMVDGDVAVAATPTDGMSFSEAFAAARAEVGAGGVFEWHGKLYNTYYKNEWDNMDANDRAEWNSNFTWGRGGNHDANDMATSSTEVDVDVDVLDITVDSEDEGWLPDEVFEDDVTFDETETASNEVASVNAQTVAKSAHHAATHHSQHTTHNDDVPASEGDMDMTTTDDIYEYDSDVEILGMNGDDDNMQGFDTDADNAYLIDVEDDLSFDDSTFDIDFDGDSSFDDLADISGDGFDDSFTDDTMDSF